MKYSGKFVVRIPPALHQYLTHQAHQQSLSLNHLCLSLLSQPLTPTPSSENLLWRKIHDKVLPTLKKHFSKDLLAILCFGSYVKGDPTEASDVDILIVLSKNRSITRKLYHEWDQTVIWDKPPELSPHFVHLPDVPQTASSLWLEVAQSHHLLFHQGKSVSKMIQKLEKVIQTGDVRKYWSSGHPYWVWR